MTQSLLEVTLFTKLNIFLTYDPAIFVFKEVESVYPHKNLHMDVYRSLNYNCQNLEEIKISSSRWINYLWCIQIMNKLSGHEKNGGILNNYY